MHTCCDNAYIKNLCLLCKSRTVLDNHNPVVHADQRGSKRKSFEPDHKARQRMQSMFKRAPARAPQRDAATDQSSEDLLSDILGSIGGDAKYDAASRDLTVFNICLD